MKSNFRAFAIPETANLDNFHTSRISRSLKSSLSSPTALARSGERAVIAPVERRHYSAFILRVNQPGN